MRDLILLIIKAEQSIIAKIDLKMLKIKLWLTAYLRK